MKVLIEIECDEINEVGVLTRCAIDTIKNLVDPSDFDDAKIEGQNKMGKYKLKILKSNVAP